VTNTEKFFSIITESSIRNLPSTLKTLGLVEATIDQKCNETHLQVIKWVSIYLGETLEQLTISSGMQHSPTNRFDDLTFSFSDDWSCLKTLMKKLRTLNVYCSESYRFIGVNNDINNSIAAQLEWNPPGVGIHLGCHIAPKWGIAQYHYTTLLTEAASVHNPQKTKVREVIKAGFDPMRKLVTIANDEPYMTHLEGQIHSSA